MILAMLSVGVLAAAAAGAPDVNDLVRQAITREIGHQRKLANYTWRDSRVTREANGKVTRVVREVFNIDGTSYRKTVERDGKPLSEADARKEQERMDREIAKRKGESASQRQKRIDAERKEFEEGLKFREEVMRAFTFRIEGEEKINGFDAWRVAGEPRADFRPKSRDGKMLAKVKGRIWIGKQTNEWLKFDVVTIDKISFGGFIATLAPGATIASQQRRINEELWHPESLRVRINARALWKRFDAEVEHTYSDFKKFQVESRLVVEEAPR